MDSHRIEAILGKIKVLEKGLIQETRSKEAEFCYVIHQQKMKFTDVAESRHKLLRPSLRQYLTGSTLLTLLTVQSSGSA